MFDSRILAILSYMIFFAGVIGAIRFKRILKSYRPFLFFVWLAFVNEVISTVAIAIWKGNAINVNIYILLEFLLVLWLFIRWDNLKRKKMFYRVLLITGCLFWVLDNVIFHSIYVENYFFRILYSLGFVYLSVEELNYILFNRGKNVLQNAKFIICLAFLIYFSYSATFEVFFFLNVDMSINFYKNLFYILVFVNLFTNIVYALAILCIPTKQEFTLPY